VTGRLTVAVATRIVDEPAFRRLAAALRDGVNVTYAPLAYRDGGGAVDVPDEWRSQLAAADVLVGFAEQFGDIGAVAPRLGWIHHCGAGYERVDLERLASRGIGLVSAAGAGADGIAEFVVLAMLSLARDAVAHHRAQEEHRWVRTATSELRGRRLTVLGAGEIGSRVCRLGAALGLDVTCVRARPALGAPSGARRVVGQPSLHEVLGATDVLVLAAPLTEQTEHVVDADALAALAPGALLVNVARAGLVDHDALVAALSDGRLGGAWLDVLPEEPLAASSPLWDVPGLSISSHNAVAIRSYPANVAAQVAAAVNDWLAGRPVAHVVLPLPAPPVSP
jgi:phosphoglycerate dehydrogenase-like enzyme